VSARRLLPSLSDCLFISLLAWLFAAGSGWTGLLADGDTGWHIRTGEFILDHGEFPQRDLFSFSRPDEPWFAWEWLADVAFAWVHRLAGLKGVVLLAGVAACASVWLVFRHMLWRGANVLLALLVCLVGAGASTIHYLARPHVFTLALAAASLWLLDRDRRKATAAVWLLVPVAAVWVNVHGGFLALLACLALVTAGTALEELVNRARGEREWGQLRRYAGLFGACSLATLLNPYGVQLHVHIAGYLRSDWIREAVHEFQSPRFRSESAMQFEILLFAGLLTAGSLLARRQFTDALLVLFWAHAALTSVRHIPVFVVAASPVWTGEVSRIWSQWVQSRSRRSLAWALEGLSRDASGGFRRTSLWIPLAVLALAWPGFPTKWPQDFPAEKFPTALIERHGARLAAARVFTSDQWADYLIYRFYPQQRVFIDGRSDFYGEKLGKLYLRLAYAQADWPEAALKWGFSAVLAPSDWPLVSLLKRDPAWRLLAEEPRAVLFERVTASPAKPD
jgi:hypothetical protein